MFAIVFASLKTTIASKAFLETSATVVTFALFFIYLVCLVLVILLVLIKVIIQDKSFDKKLL
jgi:hypothetical protein